MNSSEPSSTSTTVPFGPTKPILIPRDEQRTKPGPQLHQFSNPFLRWARSLRRLNAKQARQEQEAKDHSRELGKRFAQDSRQQRRYLAQQQTWKAVCNRMGGGRFWTGGQVEPRKARRRIARVWAKRGIPTTTEVRKGTHGEAQSE
jgi:hypothetical protein